MGIGKTLMGQMKAWGTGASKDFANGMVCSIGPAGAITKAGNDRELMITTTRARMDPYVFTQKDVQVVNVIASTSEWIKYQIVFKSNKTFVFYILMYDYNKGQKSFSSRAIEFEACMREKINFIACASKQNTNTVLIVDDAENVQSLSADQIGKDESNMYHMESTPVVEKNNESKYYCESELPNSHQLQEKKEDKLKISEDWDGKEKFKLTNIVITIITVVLCLLAIAMVWWVYKQK